MSDLRAELDAALRTVVPGDVPVEAAMRQGRRLRWRRRLAAGAGVAAVAVFAAAGYPALTRPSGGIAAVPPVQHPRIVVTAEPPGRGAPPGLIAAGTIGSKRWQVSVDASSPARQCVSGKVGGDNLTGGCYQPGMFAPSSGAPLFLQGNGDGSYTIAAGGVAASVTYLTVNLADGQQLKLIPVTIHGHRYVAFALPVTLRPVSITAYLGNGQKLTAIPFDHQGMPVAEFVMWAPPGQPEPPRATALLGSGTVSGRPWSVTAYAGPWGTCLAWVPDGAYCMAVTEFPGTGVLGSVSDSLQYVFGSATNDVSRVTVTLTNGTSLTVPARAVGGQKLWAIAMATSQHLKHWIAYDGAGNQVASGGMPAR